MAPSTSKSAKSAAKPYDKKGKGKAVVADLGTPATHGQKTRKGKKSWRKNVDITREEEALDQARAEERITGSVQASTTIARYSAADLDWSV